MTPPERGVGPAGGETAGNRAAPPARTSRRAILALPAVTGCAGRDPREHTPATSAAAPTTSAAAPLESATRGVTPAGTTPDETRLAKLTRGVNLSHWFAQTELTAARFQNYITADDADRIRTAGFRHVRLPVDPQVIFTESRPETLDPRSLQLLDAALDLFLDRGLAVVVDLHPEDAFKRRLGAEPGFVRAVARFWRTLARHVSARSPEYLFLETLNEPQVGSAAQWGTTQHELVASMREGAPRHTIVATGHQWSGVAELAALRPVADRNVVYNFHLYDPTAFTHQGATWGDAAWRHLKGLPYPSSPEAVAPVLDGISDPQARSHADAYGRERWDAARLEARVQQAVRWRAQHGGAPLTCNEFGVYRPAAPPQARLAWLRDARVALEKHGIGWAMWDYAGGFGVVREEQGRRAADADALRALGL